MILSNFIKPKWQHRNPSVRQLEIENIDDPTILNEVVHNDEATEVRRAALRKINDLNVLDQIAQHDKDNGLRELAEQRFKQLLCGQKSRDGQPLENRLAWLDKITNADWLAYVAVHGFEVELRKAAIEKVEREGLLGDIAINDPLYEVRLLAVEKLTQKSTLERVMKATRSSDKRISRRAREKRDELIEQLERPKRVRTECEDICGKLEALERHLSSEMSSFQEHQNVIEATNSLSKGNTELNRLRERWQTVIADIDTPYQTLFSQAKQAVMTVCVNFQRLIDAAIVREQAREPLRAAKQALCEQMEALLIDLKKRQRISGSDEEVFKQNVSTLQTQWGETQTIDDAQEEQKWQARFELISSTTQKQYQKLCTNHDIANQMDSICRKADALLNRAKAIKSEQLKNLQEQWDKLSQPEKSLPLFDELNARFDNILKAFQTRLQERKEQLAQTMRELKPLLKDMEAALERGELKNAAPLEQQARQLFDTIETLSTSPNKALEKRLQAGSAKINELRGWQRWGNKLEREKLCQQLEDLLNTDDPSEFAVLTEKAQTAWKRLGSSGYSRELWGRFNKRCQTLYQRYRESLCLQMENLSEHNDPEKTARVIRQAQATWRNLGSQGHSQEIWKRFNNACQIAYEPCKEFFNLKANERQQNFLEKQSLCERLETFTDNTDWENPDWKEVYRSVREIEKSWKSTGATDRRVKKTVQRRYQAAITVLETNLDEERQRNCHYRLHLVIQVEEIAHNLKEVVEALQSNTKLVETEINKAIEGVKKVQEQWQVTVSGTRSIEREFWQDFRGACDMVFNYRKQQQDAHKKELQAYIKSKIALCEQVEALTDLDAEAIKVAPTKVKQLKEEWKKIKKEDWKKITSLQKKAKATEAVEERFERACQRVEKQCWDQLATERRWQMDILRRKAAFCTEFEQTGTIARLQIPDDSDRIAAIQTAWAEFPNLEKPDTEAAIEQRFQQAVASTGGSPELNEKILKAKETLCVRMEILAGVESPPEGMPARLAYQVARLSAAMSNGEKESQNKLAEVEDIERHWYLSDAVYSEQKPRLEQRFSHAREEFYLQNKLMIND